MDEGTAGDHSVPRPLPSTTTRRRCRAEERGRHWRGAREAQELATATRATPCVGDRAARPWARVSHGREQRKQAPDRIGGGGRAREGGAIGRRTSYHSDG